jgi:hypothetical protein
MCNDYTYSFCLTYLSAPWRKTSKDGIFQSYGVYDFLFDFLEILAIHLTGCRMGTDASRQAGHVSGFAACQRAFSVDGNMQQKL